MTYILDMVVNEGQFTHALTSPNKPIWIMFKVDGTNSSISTPKVMFSAKSTWDFKLRVTPQISSLEKAYIYVNLCTLSEKGDQVVSVAVSKVGLKNLPVGNPRSFKFPLMSTTNTAIQVGQLKLTATISAFVAKPMFNSSSQMVGMPMSPFMYATQPRPQYSSNGFAPPSYSNVYQSSPK